MGCFWRQRGYAKGKSYLTNLITIYDEITRSVDEGKQVDFDYLDCSKAFDAVSCSILVYKLGSYGLVGWKLGFQSVVNVSHTLDASYKHLFSGPSPGICPILYRYQ